MPPKPTPDDEVRAQLMAGLVSCVASRGYASVTINDIVKAAHVSKSTFYAQFSGKEECFLATYEFAAATVLQVIIDSADSDLPYEDRVMAATMAYMERAAQDPDTTRTFILEVLAAGPDALEMRHQVNRRFANVLIELVDQAKDPRIGPLSEAAALLVVGGANELVLAAIVEDRLDELPDQAPVVARALLSEVTGE